MAKPNIFRRTLYSFQRCLGHISPKAACKFQYFRIFHENLVLPPPTSIRKLKSLDLNHKIQWLKLYGDTSQWSRLADKYAVRRYVEEKGLADILNTLYGVWDKVDDIDFGKLPQSFVLKTNHGCGDIILVEDKNKMDIKTVKRTLAKSLKRKYGYGTAELHYTKIPPRIIAERYLKQDGNLSSSLIDYKFYCMEGEPHSVLIAYDRIIGVTAKMLIYDVNPWRLNEEASKYQLNQNNIPDFQRPKNLDKMLKICRVLAQSFPQVRVDLYEINGKVYFGELTFTSAAGFERHFPKSYLEELGRYVHLPVDPD